MTIESKYRKKILASQAAAELQMRRVYNRYIDNVSKYANNKALKLSASFKFRKNDLLGAILSGEAYEEFKDGLYAINKNVVTGAWEMAGEKNGEAFGSYILLLKQYTGKEAFSMDINQKALAAFINSSGGKSLSARVWKPAQQFRDEMAVHLGMGIANGDSAATISRRTRQYLEKPDALFRRVKTQDQYGNDKWQWSKRAKAYNPGRGVYRSAFKNSMRVARTQTNQAYFQADQNMWRQQKFVLGYEVILSPSHPKIDICDDLKGKYPKTFTYSGWHTQCSCTMIPVKMSEKTFISYLKGNRVKVPKYDLPHSFKSFVARNEDKFLDHRVKTYWVKDNLVVSKGKVSFEGSPIRLPKRPLKNIAHESVYEKK